MPETFAENETDDVLLVDATNAFNSMNRRIMPHNIQYICPALAIYIFTCYVTASRLFVQGGKEVTSAKLWPEISDMRVARARDFSP